MKTCIVCGKPLNGSKKKFCCQACKQKDYYTHHKNNSSYEQHIRSIKRKLELIQYKGGKCEICGYSKNITALEFHHVDSNMKKFNLDGRKLANCNINDLLEEADKCMLLCANCHREIHYEEYGINNVKYIVEHQKVLKEEKEQHCCIDCGKILSVDAKSKYCKVCYLKHSQDRRKVERPSKDELAQLLQSHSLNKIGKMFGVSHAAIKKWGIQYGIIKE